MNIITIISKITIIVIFSLMYALLCSKLIISIVNFIIFVIYFIYDIIKIIFNSKLTYNDNMLYNLVNKIASNDSNNFNEITIINNEDNITQGIFTLMNIAFYVIIINLVFRLIFVLYYTIYISDKKEDNILFTKDDTKFELPDGIIIICFIIFIFGILSHNIYVFTYSNYINKYSIFLRKNDIKITKYIYDIIFDKKIIY